MSWFLMNKKGEERKRKEEIKKQFLKVKYCCLKVLTNEKRGGVRVVSFGRPPFKLFSQKFSNKSVQALSCERPKTSQRTLFLLFANINCFPITLLCRAAAHFSHRKLN
jgi:hypothetical protein